MYKGYEIEEVVTYDYEHPKTEVIVKAPSGCSQCQEMGIVQPGHKLCELLPEDLMNDDWVYPSLDDSMGWILIWQGPDKHVDHWLEVV